MTLTDTGPLVALIDEKDDHHQRITSAATKVESWPLATTEACLTEALYLLGRNAGLPGQEALWRFVEDGSLVILSPSSLAPLRSRAFMMRYSDSPCDYADATLLVAAEDVGLRQVFTIDKHFHAYRLTNGGPLVPLP